MIIVKTKNGDRFINDKAVMAVEHDKEKAEVTAYIKEGVFFHIEEVESVFYTNDAQPTSWKDEGLEIERLKMEQKQKASAVFNEMLDRPITDYPLSIMASSCLKSANINTLRELVRLTTKDLLKFRNFGNKTVSELCDFIKDHNLSWGMDVSTTFHVRADYSATISSYRKPKQWRKKNASAKRTGMFLYHFCHASRKL